MFQLFPFFVSVQYGALGISTFANVAGCFNFETTRRGLLNFVTFDVYCYVPGVRDHSQFSNFDVFQLVHVVAAFTLVPFQLADSSCHKKTTAPCS